MAAAGALPAPALADTAPSVAIDAPSSVTATSAHLSGTVNPNGGPSATSWRFEYSQNPEVEGWTEVGAGSAEAGRGVFSGKEAEETIPLPVQANFKGLASNTTYEVRLVATNEGGKTVSAEPNPSFTTPTAVPRITGESFSNVGSASASVSATINAGGLPTIYQVEYGTTAAYGSSSPPVSIGAAGTDVAVLTGLSNLQPLASYHLRVLATNALGATFGADLVLTTFPAGSLSLPDGRAFEMVTPVFNEDADVYQPYSGAGGVGIENTLPAQASVNGNAVSYTGSPTAGGNGSSGQGGGNQYLATRSGAGGWIQRVLQPPGFASPLYTAFSPDLSHAILCSHESLVASAPPRYVDLYDRINADGSYHPLSTVTPPGREWFEFESPPSAGLGCGFGNALTFAGASGDFEHLLFLANAALTPDAPEGPPSENNLYDSTNGHLTLVNVLPNGQREADATFGGPTNEPADPSRNPPDFSHVISEDGSRVVWTDLHAGPNMEHIFMREHATTTAAVSPGPARFWTASADDRYVFYTEAGALYRFDADTATREELTDAGSTVKGVLGASDDGATVYFAAGGALASGAEPLVCEEFSTKEEKIKVMLNESEGKFVAGVGCNVYMLRVGSAPTFVARLATLDGFQSDPFGRGGDGQVGDWQPGLGHRTAEVTPDGEHLLFMSRMSLTGYPNTIRFEDDPRIVHALSEVYLYDASTDSLACASCSRSGEAPPFEPGLPDSQAAAFIPASFSNTYMRRAISADGNRVFFNSTLPLVPQDRNGERDVYEWERNGVGSCHEPSGCIYLLSGGTSAAQSSLVDASENGDDVFIVTRAKLVPQDGNENFDVYDVRVGGAQPASGPTCSGAGCQGVPPAPPSFATPSSTTFSGAGNFPPAPLASRPSVKALTRAQKLAKALKACKRKSNRSRPNCERKARRLYGSKPKSTSHKRGK